MSSRKGGQREYRVGEKLVELGYRVAFIKGSGQRRINKARRAGFEASVVAGDLLAFYEGEAGLADLIVEVGGIGKRGRGALRELDKLRPKRHLPIVARCQRRHWTFKGGPGPWDSHLRNAIWRAMRRHA